MRARAPLRRAAMVAAFSLFALRALAGAVRVAGTGSMTSIVGSGSNQLLGESLAIGDLDGDGMDDLVARARSPERVVVFLGRAAWPATWDLAATPPDVTISHSRRVSTGAIPGAPAVGDVDGDGRGDLVIMGVGDGPTGTTPDTPQVLVFLGRAS